MSSALNRWLIFAALACLALWLGWSVSLGFKSLTSPHHPQQADYVGSAVCADCHSGRMDSWYSTYHRTMTQEAGPDSVQGRFDGQLLDYYDMQVRPVEENGRFFFDYYDPASGTHLNRIGVARTVGSNRYQQYLTHLPEDGSYVRLHYLWHNQDQRWVHMNAAFLGPDGRHFDEHIAVWNQNCIFCHNTGPQPRITNYEEMRDRAARGEAVDVSRDARFESKVAELGIACETCHGPGETHVERAQSFWTRAAMRLAPGRDVSIVNPVRLDPERASHVCAQCHAQRMPLDSAVLRQWMDTGPSYRPGNDLRDHVDPVFRHTRAPIAGQEDLFRNRFWGDGTPRLTAYEYQGLYLSACYQEAKLSCMDCHSMHAGDPAGQITDRNRGNAPCLRCHQEFRRDTDLVEHSRHPADSSASLCYNCHMPELNFGIMAIHRSHRIEVPDAHRDAAGGRPNACLNCHVEESFQWAASALGEWNGDTVDGRIVERQDGGSAALSDLATVLVGDPAQKAVMAWRAGQSDLYQRGRERAWMVAYLLEAMNDVYPSTRRFSAKSLTAILADWPRPEEVVSVSDLLADFDFMADEQLRGQQLGRIRQSWAALDKSGWPLPPPQSGVGDDFNLPGALVDELVELGRRQDKQISIGE